MLKIGLTGGIGSGKSAATKLFEQLGIPVIDADIIAREVVVKGQPALTEIVQHFGAQVLHPDESLNREALRNIIFSNAEHKKTLESIIHPRVYQAMLAQSGQYHSPYLVFAIPLLLENQRQNLMDRILVVDCPVETQIQRVQQRDNLSVTQIKAIISAQIARPNRLAAADDIIHNDGSFSALAEQVKKLHNLYLSLPTSP